MIKSHKRGGILKGGVSLTISWDIFLKEFISKTSWAFFSKQHVSKCLVFESNSNWTSDSFTSPFALVGL